LRDEAVGQREREAISDARPDVVFRMVLSLGVVTGTRRVSKE